MSSFLSGLLNTKALAMIAGSGATFWMPEGRSTAATDLDQLFYIILWVSVFFFALIVGLIVYFMLKYRRKGDEVVVQKSTSHHLGLELLWSGIPLIIVLVIFVMGFRGFLDLTNPPDDSYEIQVMAQKWNWSFTYPNGYEDSELHVPVGRPVKLIMASQDVLHSFFVPELRVKQDVVPGRYTMVWFEATDEYEGTVFCTEYCGTSHSEMQSRYVAHTPDEFDDWLRKASNWMEGMAPVDAGAVLYDKRGCTQCHSVDGSTGIGPTFLDSFGGSRSFKDGSTGTVDENYIRSSLLEPQAKVVSGYDPVMPTFQGRLNEAEIAALIAYIKSLGS